MAQEIEIEFKNLLTKSEFNQLQKSLFNDVKPVTQINYYFETEDFKLQATSSALRIREKDNQYELTLKEPHPQGLLETHDALTMAEARQWIANSPNYQINVGKQLDALNVSVDSLQYVGNLKTVRLERKYLDTIIVLDYSTYHNTEDFEFELEATSRERGEKVFQELMSIHQILIKPTANKIERFFSVITNND